MGEGKALAALAVSPSHLISLHLAALCEHVCARVFDIRLSLVPFKYLAFAPEVLFYLNDLFLSPSLPDPLLHLSPLFPSPSHRAMQKVFGENRTLILTRSSFPGVGKYSGHWLGDNAANWNDIKWAIPGMLEFGLFGVPYVSSKPPHKGRYCSCSA